MANNGELRECVPIFSIGLILTGSIRTRLKSAPRSIGKLNSGAGIPGSTGPQEVECAASVDSFCPANYTTLLLRQLQGPLLKDFLGGSWWGIVQR
jgi:hypothetical protein